MYRRRRRFRRKASWTYADSGSLVCTSATTVAWMWLLPPARAQFLMDTRQRNRMLYVGSHLWLDFYWENKNSGGAQFMPDADFVVMKSVITSGDMPELSAAAGQWTQPSTPATLTSWNEDDDDGTESFLWQHHIKGFSPPNATVNVANTGQTAGSNHETNQSNLIDSGTVDSPTYVCRKFNVTQEWQPDVVVRSKRRLQKDEGIVLVMSSNPVVANFEVICNVHFRTLTS